jgi:hypothetical protein
MVNPYSLAWGLDSDRIYPTSICQGSKSPSTLGRRGRYKCEAAATTSVDLSCCFYPPYGRIEGLWGSNPQRRT